MASPYEGVEFSGDHLRGIVWANDHDAALEEATMDYRGAVGAMSDLQCGERKFLPDAKLKWQDFVRLKVSSLIVIKQLAQDEKQINDSLYGRTYQ